MIYLAAFYIKPLSRLSATQDNQARAVLTSLAAVLGMAGYESPLTRVMLSEVDVNAADKGEKINKLLSASQQALFKIHQNMQQRISAASQAGARPASAGPTLQRGDSFREIIGIADPESAAPAPAAACVLPGNPVTVPAPVSPGLTSAPAQ